MVAENGCEEYPVTWVSSWQHCGYAGLSQDAYVADVRWEVMVGQALNGDLNGHDDAQDDESG